MRIGSQLINPVVQEFRVDEATKFLFDYAIEVGFLPGVTDNVGNTAKQTIEDYLSMKFVDGEAVYSSQLFLSGEYFLPKPFGNSGRPSQTPS